ncbi:tetratricopeptide repeat protein [Mucilaginibacter sp.]|uniref:tetratricopeptide repeat protein n=1 Tax=Mucilaginibacter sp. TaxID=1882438 RepID=UPI003D13C48E
MKQFLTITILSAIIFCGNLFAQTGKDYKDIADALLEKKNYKLAADNYTKAIPHFKSIKKKLSELYDGRAECEQNLKLYDKALADALKATTLDPNNGSAYWDLGSINSDMGNHKLSIDNYTRAMPFYQDNDFGLSNLYDNRADEELDLHMYDKTIVDDSLALKLNPKNGNAYWHRGIAFDDSGNYQRGIADYSAAILFQDKDDKENLAILFDDRAGCEKKLKDYLKAINDENFAILLQSENGEYYWSRGAIYADNGDYQLATTDYTKAIALLKDNKKKLAKLYSNRGANETELKQFDKAIADYNIAISLNPVSGAYYWERAIAYTSMGNFKQSIDDYLKAATLYKDDNKNIAIIYNNCADNAYFMNDYQKVIDYSTKAIELNPTYSSPYYYRAKTYLKKLNKKDAAIPDFKKVLELDTTKKSVNYIFSLFYTGDYNQACKILQDKIINNNNSYDLLTDYYNMACLLSLMNKLPEANLYLKKAVDAGY